MFVITRTNHRQLGDCHWHSGFSAQDDMSHPKKTLYKVIMLGDSGVGKTSIISRFVHDTWSPSYKPTIYADFCSKNVMLDDNTVTLQIWDTPGQERYKALTATYYRGADCCVLAFDTTDADSFENLAKWREEFLRYIDPTDQGNFPFVVMANKVDSPERKVTEKVADEWCRKYNMSYIEISAKCGSNVQLAFENVARKAIEQEKQREGGCRKSTWKYTYTHYVPASQRK